MRRSARTMFKNIVLLVAIFVCFGLAIYFTYFHRPPTADILAANLALQADDDYDDDDGDVTDDTDDVMPNAKTSQKSWDRWIRVNRYVSIGRLYDRCEGDDRVMLGRVVMLPDHVTGGVTSKTFFNITLDRDISGGQMYLTCQYNGNDLYSNHWDLCTAEEGMDTQVINCPIRTGRRKFIKELKIPNYLPKGRYSTKAWLVDQDEKTISCAFAEFTI